MRSRRSRKLSHTQTSVPCGTLNQARNGNLMNILTASHLFTFVCEGMMHAEFNSVTLFTILWLLEFRITHLCGILMAITPFIIWTSLVFFI